MAIHADILNRLTPVTEEERCLLENGSIDSALYTENGGTVINSKMLLEMGKLITLRPHTRFVDFPPHTHDYVEVIYMCTGQTVHVVNGNTITLREGELLFLSTQAVQEIKRAEREDIAVNFIIQPPFFDHVLQMLGEEETPLKSFVLDCLTGKSTGSSYLHFKVADVLPVQNLVENLLYTLIGDVPNRRNVNQITIGLLFLQLINHTDRLQTEQKTDAVLLEVFRYVEEHYSSGSLSELCALLRCDVYWLSREIKKVTGKTYTELLQEKRLSQAAFLLRTTKITIADISVAVGYENVSYFHRLFTKRFGVTPRRYRLCK